MCWSVFSGFTLQFSRSVVQQVFKWVHLACIQERWDDVVACTFPVVGSWMLYLGWQNEQTHSISASQKYGKCSQGIFLHHGSGNGLVPSGNTPLPELMLTCVCCRRSTCWWSWVGSSCLFTSPQGYVTTSQGIPILIARLMGPTWGPSGADRTHVGPMLAPWTLLSGYTGIRYMAWQELAWIDRKALFLHWFRH